MRALTILAVLFLAPLTDAVTQDQPLRPGQRVRVTAPNLGLDMQTATFQRFGGDTLVLSSASYPLSEIARLDMHQGQRGHFWLGAGIGAGIGAVPGVVIALQLCENDWVCRDDLEAEAALLGFGIGGVVGGLLGGGIGALIKTDKWVQVPLDRLRVSVVPQRRGRFGFGMSVNF